MWSICVGNFKSLVILIGTSCELLCWCTLTYVFKQNEFTPVFCLNQTPLVQQNVHSFHIIMYSLHVPLLVHRLYTIYINKSIYYLSDCILLRACVKFLVAISSLRRHVNCWGHARLLCSNKLLVMQIRN
jgi:hypothetical protein